jgi:hypothetical protein
MTGTLDGGVADPACHSMFKTPERKEFPSRRGGTLADNRPILFDAKRGQMVSQAQEYLVRTCMT